MENPQKQLKQQVQAGKVIVGTERVLKLLKEKKLSKVFIANNCPEKIKNDLSHYSQLSGIPLVELELNNEELGVFCKKNFLVSVIGLTEE